MSMTFLGLPNHKGLPWLQNFRGQTRMICTHTCTMQDFNAQTELIETRLGQGFISSTVDEERFQRATRRLRASRLGLLCHKGEFCVLISPPEGGVASSEFGKDAVILDFLVFKPSACFDPSMLAPLAPLDCAVP